MSKGKGQMSNEGPKATVQSVRHVEPPVETSVDYSIQINGENGGAWTLREEPSSPNSSKVYDLLERTAAFAEAIIKFSKRIPRSPGNDRLIGQLVGAGTSIGANYCEADDAVSKKDFKHKIGICRKEAKECKFWLRMIATAEESLKQEARPLWKEARELHLILCAVFRKY